MEEQPARHLIRVAVAPPYTVTVGAGVLPAAAAAVAGRRTAVVTDENVASLAAPVLEAALDEAGCAARRYVVPPGEDSKSPEVWASLLRAFARDGLDRDCAVVALGGGVVGDLAGFVAATYLRGVAFVQVPTSLLAMVDASVGGKTALDLPEGKNLVGAFWQPRAVVSDVRLLRTLPEAEFRQGAVELFKHGLLADPALLDRVGEGFSSSMPEGDLSEAVARSVAVKADVVARDEREGGARAHLNLGHTLGHALEAITDHRLPHGEAVAYGLLYAALLARDRGWADVTPRILRLLRWVAPAPLPDVSFDDLAPFLARDKKARRGVLRFVLLEDVARPRVVADVREDALRRAWAELREVLDDPGA